MSLRNVSLAIACLCVAGAAYTIAEDKEAFKAKCIVAGDKDAKQDKSAEYKGGKVYFCCDGCLGAFKKDQAKFATKANAQLVSTKQAKQTKCPISGGDLNQDTAVEVGGVKVAFCCNNCKKKVTDAQGDEQLNLVFSDTAFDKGFEKPKAK